MKYEFRTDEQETALQHLAHSPYVFDNMPYLNTNRYSLSGYEPHHITAKAIVDEQGIADNLWWWGRKA